MKRVIVWLLAAVASTSVSEGQSTPQPERLSWSKGESHCFSSATADERRLELLFASRDHDQSSDTDFAIARYKTDGSLDTTFGSGGEVATDFNLGNDDALAIILQPDGRIVAAGDATSLATFTDFALTRYLPDGSLDTTFGAAGKA